jgi:uncharacterized protein
MQKSFDREAGKYYHARLMSNELVIDSISFAKKSESLQGKIAVASLERLRTSLASAQGEIEFRLQGTLDSRHRPSLSLALAGEVQLTCQRCLGDFPLPLKLESRIVLVVNETDLPDLEQEDPDVDVLVASGRMNVQDLLEDEIILALPLAPKHDFDCVEINNDDDAAGDSGLPFASLGKPN